MTQQIHQTQPVVQAGTPLEEAKAVVIFVHGRGDSGRGIMSLANDIFVEGVTYLAPNAVSNTWYPNRFIAPREANEPYLSSAIDTVGALLKMVGEAGIPPEKTMIVGFSQGACLATEVAARNPRKYGGIAALSGGLIGAEGELEGYEGSLDGTPVFLGCSDVDFHIPVERVHETRDIMANLDAKVDERIYPNFGHAINQDEIQAVKAMLEALV